MTPRPLARATPVDDVPAPARPRRSLIRLKRIYNFLCSMLVFTPFALCFVTLHGIFMQFLELTY
jgi:hypothetical protein